MIPASRVVLPTPIGTTLVDLNNMLQSVNPQDLQTDENFLASAFVGTGPDLRTIIVTGQRLFNALVAAQPETVNLVVDGQTDLQTLEATDGDLATFSQGLASVTRQLRDSNGDVQALIRNSQAAEEQLNPFLAADSTQIIAASSPTWRTDRAGDRPAQPGHPGPLRAPSCRLPGPGVGGGQRGGSRRARVQHGRSGVPLHPRGPDAGADAAGGQPGTHQQVHRQRPRACSSAEPTAFRPSPVVEQRRRGLDSIRPGITDG